MPNRASASDARRVSPALVVAASWLLPGLGYVLLGQRTRGITIGVTVISLFIAGLLIGGVRVLEVPGYGPHGKPVMAYVGGSGKNNDPLYYVFSDIPTRDTDRAVLEGRAIFLHPMDELRAKPWSIAQVMVGPIAFIGGAAAVSASQRGAGEAAPGARSHSRVNEIGVLYTAIAGMLNLLAIIDAQSRASEATQPAAPTREAR